MPRKLLKRIMPDPHKFHNYGFMRVLGDWVHDPNLWHLNRRSAAVACFIGLFCAFIPLPSQMFIAAVLSIFFHSNLPLSMCLVWVTNPLTMGPIFYGSYMLGAKILQTPPSPFQMELSWQWISHELALIWQPLVLGSLLCGVFFGALGYFFAHWVWRWHVVKRWEARKLARERLSANSSDS